MDLALHHRARIDSDSDLTGTVVRNGAQLLVECLYRHGVRHVFGMPGSHSTYIYDAIQRHGGIQTILCRNEQAGAFMADGYARATGRPGVVCTTAGPGATNALTGIAEAYSDSVPVLLIAGQVNHDRIHEECGRYHEIDLEGIFRPCVRFAGTVMRNGQIPPMVDRAFEAMIAGRPGPAALMLPQDLMALPAPDSPRVFPSELRRVASCNGQFEKSISQAIEQIRMSQRPVILAGGGCVSSGAAEQVEELARRLGCPVVTTLNGKGILDERSELAFGHARTRRARAIMSRADLLIAIGCRFTEVLTASGTIPIPKRIIQIDIDPKQIGTNYSVEVGIVGDARTILQAVVSGLPHREISWKEIWKRARSAEQLKPEWLIDTLRAELPETSVIFADACEIGLRMQTDFPAYAPRTFFYPSNFATLGWGLPAAVGAAAGQPDRWTVCVSGDGGFLMTAQELATAARYNLRIIVVIHNGSAYGAIKALQRTKHESRYLDVDLNNPDLVKFGESFGVPSCQARNSEEFASALQRALQNDGTSLIEAPEQWRSVRL
jgi:acetolactate synthase I/II/III large subunit